MSAAAAVASPVVARTNLKDAWEILRVAVSDLKAVDEEVATLTIGVDIRPLPRAAARVLQEARTAAAVASRVLQVAEVAEVGAGQAAAPVAATESVTATASSGVAETETEAMAAWAVVASHMAGVTAQMAGVVAASATVALGVKIETAVPEDHMCVHYALGCFCGCVFQCHGLLVSLARLLEQSDTILFWPYYDVVLLFLFERFAQTDFSLDVRCR